MPPIPASENVVDGLRTDIVLVGQSFLENSTRGIAGTDSKHTGFVKFCQTLLCSLGLSSLGVSVVRVIALCTKEKMVGSDTASVIATMKYTQSIRDRAVRQFPGDAMCCSSSVFYGPQSIAIAKCAASPVPAAIALLDFRPKSFDKHFSHGRTSDAIRVRNSNDVASVVAVPS